MTIEEFADVILKNIVMRRYANQDNRWTATFDGAEVKDTEYSSILQGSYGNGKNPTDAIINVSYIF